MDQKYQFEMWCEWAIKFYYRTHRCFVVLVRSSYYYPNEGSDALIFSVVSERHALQSLNTTLPHQGCTGDRKPEGYLKVSQELCFQALFSLILGFFFPWAIVTSWSQHGFCVSPSWSSPIAGRKENGSSIQEEETGQEKLSSDFFTMSHWSPLSHESQIVILIG